MYLKKPDKIINTNYIIFKNNISVIIILIIIFEIISSNEKFLIKLNFYSEITITIKGTGKQKILSDSTKCAGENVSYQNYTPNKILIDGLSQNYTGIYAYNLTKEINNITMIWYTQLTTCQLMFFGINNIISSDFSKFDTSKVTDMKCMFSLSSSFTSLDLSNFNTSSVRNMKYMFSDTSLITLDLNNFDTSSVTTFYCIFYNCSSLISLNINNFNLKSAEAIDYMFYGCTSLISLDLYNFDTTKINLCCDFFIFINHLIIRINETKAANINQYIKSTFIKNSSDICFINPSHKLIKDNEIKKCVNNCIDETKYKYEFKNICYDKCPENTYYFNEIICIDYIPDGYYLNLDNKTMPCYYTCKTCNQQITIA